VAAQRTEPAPLSQRAEKALSLFDSRYNCAQAVLASYGPDYGLEETMALKLASVFGGGVARTGGVCGAVTGALMVLSLRFCDAKPKGLFQKPIHKKAREFLRRYEEMVGSVNCNAMRGHDPSSGKYVKGGNEACPGFVELACRLLEDSL